MVITPIQMRFADTDMLGHVNNVNQQHYFDVGKSDFFSRIPDFPHSWMEEGLITVSTSNNYLQQIRYGENISVRTRVAEIGNKSFTLFQQIINTDTDEVKADSHSVLVAFNFATQLSIPLPETWREGLEKYR